MNSLESECLELKAAGVVDEATASPFAGTSALNPKSAEPDGAQFKGGGGTFGGGGADGSY